MRTLRTIGISIAALLATVGMAQSVTAEAYFNQASKEFIKQDKLQALRTLDNGLRQYPSDPRLLKLAEALVKEDEQQQQQDQKKEQEQKQDQQEKDQQEKDQQQGQVEQEQQQKEQQEQEKKESDPQRAEQKEGEQQEGKPDPGTIAPQDALRMLDALERSEEDVQEKVRVKLRPTVRRPIEKDW
jgi:cell division protein FtsN